MERKDYLLEDLSKEEKSYLRSIIVSAKNTYLRRNWNNINMSEELKEDIVDSSDNLLETIFADYEKNMRNIAEFENLFSNITVYKIIKALSLQEKMVLFLLYKENKSVLEVSSEMKIRRETVWRIKTKVQDKILKSLLGGNKDVQ